MTNSILSALVNGAIAGAVLAGAIRAGLFLARGMFSAAARYAVWWAAERGSTSCHEKCGVGSSRPSGETRLSV